MGNEFDPRKATPADAVEYYPYFGGRYLAVAASLNGGNVLAAFVRMLQQWTHELGDGVPQATIWERLLACGSDDRGGTALSDADLPVVDPMLYGERHQPGARGAVRNLGPVCVGLGDTVRAICRGLLQNLHSMMTRERLVQANVGRVVGTGSALTRNPVLQQAVRDMYNLDLELGRSTDAALGAVIAVLLYAGSDST